MEGQKLSNRSRLGERQGPWLSHSLTQSLTESLTHSFSTENAGAGAVHCQFMFQTLHATSQDGSSLAFFAAAAGRECNIQDARGRGLCPAGHAAPPAPAATVTGASGGGGVTPLALHAPAPRLALAPAVRLDTLQGS